MGDALIGDLSITMEDGTVLRDRTDVALAGKWAEHVIGTEAWKALTFRERTAHTAEALRELRRAAEA
jgi:hypothetical protein